MRIYLSRKQEEKQDPMPVTTIWKHSLISLISLYIAPPCHAVEILIHNPCAETPWLSTNQNLTSETSLGAMTIAALNQRQMPYEGNEIGLRSINGTATGDAALEVISGREMRAYGWCFHLNGVEPALTADQVKITSNNDKITWFFAYARYFNGQWADMCVPTHIHRPKFICP